jgi:rhodanese-related sulfurtransferase
MKRLILSLIAGLTVFSFSAAPRPLASVDTLSADTLSAWMAGGPPSDFLLIDVRETSELAGGVIGTAACNPYNLAWTTHSFDSSITKLPMDKAIVLYCASGYRSGKADSSLLAAGFTTVYSLRGGFNGWHGQTEASSNVKPVSDLPAPSMLRTSVLAAPASGSACRPAVRLSEKNGILMCNERLSGVHTVSFFTLDGRCVGKMLNPFSSQLLCRPLNGFGRGIFVVRLETAWAETIPLVVNTF